MNFEKQIQYKMGFASFCAYSMNKILRDFNILSKNFPNKSSCDKMSYDITMKTTGGTLVYGL